MERQDHWDQVWTTKHADEVSWHQARPDISLRLIEAAGTRPDGPIADIGGGASRLVDHLASAGFTDVTVLDIAAAALQQAQARLGPKAKEVRWVQADVLEAPPQDVALWHDRAVFHFLTDDADRQRYATSMARAVRPGGHAILATFAPDGPERCSGLPVRRHSRDDLIAAAGEAFEPVTDAQEEHVTPWGATQHFQYVLLRRLPNAQP